MGKRGASYVGLVPFDLSQTGGIVVVSERCIVSSFGSPLLGVIMHYCSVLFWTRTRAHQQSWRHRCTGEESAAETYVYVRRPRRADMPFFFFPHMTERTMMKGFIIQGHILFPKLQFRRVTSPPSRIKDIGAPSALYIKSHLAIGVNMI